MTKHQDAIDTAKKASGNLEAICKGMLARNERKLPAHWGPLPHTFLTRGLRCYEACGLNFAHGYDPECIMLARSIAELAIDFAWMNTEETEQRVGWFNDHYAIGLEKHFKILKEFGVAVPDEQLLPQTAKRKAVMKERKQWCRDRDRKAGSWQSIAWAPYSIDKRAEQADQSVLYRAVYFEGSFRLHSGPQAVNEHLEIDHVNMTMSLTEAQPIETPFAMFLASLSLLELAGVYASVMGEPAPEFDLIAEFGGKSGVSSAGSEGAATAD